MPEPKSKNLMMVVCALLHGLNHSFNLILPPLYLSIRDDLGLDKLSLVTLFGTVYFFTYAVMNLPFGILADIPQRDLQSAKGGDRRAVIGILHDLPRGHT